MKKEKRSVVISLGDDGAIIGCYLGNRLFKRLFVTSHQSSDFIEVTKQLPDASIYLLLDIIDQNYVFSSIPNVGAGSVKKIVKRKLENEFDKNDLNSCIFLGKDKPLPTAPASAKTTLKYLFVSIRNSNPFKDWVEAIGNLPNKFGGVYLIPVEAEDFISKLRKATHGEDKETPDEWEILVSYNRVGGLRQVVLKNGKLIFTRISQSVSLQTPDSVGKSISQESANTLEYIRRIGFYDQPISIYVISSKESSNFIEIPGVKERDIYHYSPFELSQRLKIEQSAQESDKFGDVVFATSFISNKKKILKIATPTIAKTEKLLTLSKAFSTIAMGLSALFLLGSIYMGYDGYSKIADIELSNAQAARKSSELEGIKSFEKEYGVNPENIQESVKFKEGFADKDKFYFDLVEKYRAADVFSKYIKDVEFLKPDSAGKKSIFIIAVFDFSDEVNYSDVLNKYEQYKVAINKAFEGYTVELQGLPSEKDIKVDLRSKRQRRAKQTK